MPVTVELVLKPHMDVVGAVETPANMVMHDVTSMDAEPQAIRGTKRSFADESADRGLLKFVARSRTRMACATMGKQPVREPASGSGGCGRPNAKECAKYNMNSSCQACSSRRERVPSKNLQYAFTR